MYVYELCSSVDNSTVLSILMVHDSVDSFTYKLLGKTRETFNLHCRECIMSKWREMM